MIEILMAAYNGESYIAEQIESIIRQTESNWHLTVCDDCSTDCTAQIVKEFEEKYAGKITYRRNEKNLGGSKQNFFSMLKSADADYVMTCDQDDVWLPDKIARTLSAMKDLELQYGSEIPLLVHTDLKIVDQFLNVLSGSMFFTQNLNSSAVQLNELLVQNNVTGCTMMINRALLNLFPDAMPPDMIMHDWWAPLIAAAFGAIGFVTAPTILYRQHSANVVGAKSTRSLWYNLKRAVKGEQVRKVLVDTYRQAGDFAACYGDRLTPAQKELVTAFAEMEHCGKLKKLKTLRRYHLWKTGTARRLGQILYS